MYFFDSFIITQRTFYMVLGFIVLFLGTILNFALAGLFQKKSQKFSNIVTISTLIISAICLLPFVLGFLNPHSVSSIYFFNKNIAFGGLEILLCIISQITVLAAFLVSKKQLSKMRFKQHYFNSLYLCSAFSLNFLIISKGFIPFILSLEILSICTFYIMQASKTRADFYSTYKYISFSLYATIAMIFAYALSCGFSINSGILPVIAKGIFISALLAKGGFSVIFTQTKENAIKGLYPAFSFINLVILYAYTLALHKIIHEFFETGSAIQIFFGILLPICAIIGALKAFRAKSFQDFIYLTNSTNYCIVAFLLFIQNTQVHTGAILLLINALIINTGLLSACEILSANKKTNVTFEDFRGTCYTNQLYCNLLSIAIFITVSAIPSGIFASRFYINAALAQTGLWSSIITFIFSVVYTILIIAALNFISVFYKKPDNIKKDIYKKRTRLNYSILFVSIVLSLAMLLGSSKIATLLIKIL